VEGGSFPEDPEGYVAKALETGIFIGAPLGNLEGARIPGTLKDE